VGRARRPSAAADHVAAVFQHEVGAVVDQPRIVGADMAEEGFHLRWRKVARPERLHRKEVHRLDGGNVGAHRRTQPDGSRQIAVEALAQCGEG
jgi:hypothetical protein